MKNISRSVPGQQRCYRCDDAEQVEERVLQQPLHGPVGVGGGVAGGTGGVVAQSHSEEQSHAEGDRQPVHPGLRGKEESPVNLLGLAQYTNHDKIHTIL